MKPLVSCVCVTADRRNFIPAMIKCFLSQDWPEKELVVVDDGQDSVRDLFAKLGSHCNYIYAKQSERMRIGEKRNLACEAARGQIICHFDDDDWSAGERLREQVRLLFTSLKAVVGYHSMLFWDGTEAFKYKGPPDYSLGSGLCYRKDFWQRHPFVPENPRRWEDNVFVQEARNENEITAVDAMKVMVARIHAGNTCAKKPRENPRQWSQVDVSEIPSEFLESAVSLAM